MRRSITVTALIAILVGASPAVAWTSPRPIAEGRTNPPLYSVAFDSGGGYHLAVSGQFGIGGLWSSSSAGAEMVSGTGARGYIVPAIALDVRTGPDAVRIAWYDQDDDHALWVSDDDTGHWTSRRVWLGHVRSVAVAPLGHGLAVAFTDGADRLRFLTWDRAHGPSRVRTITSRACCDGIPAVAVTKAGLVWLAYAESDLGSGDGRLHIARRSITGGWSDDAIAAGAPDDPSLAIIGNASDPVVGFGRDDGVWLVRHTTHGWQRSKVLGSSWYGPAIADDGTGRIGVAATTGGRIGYRRGSSTIVTAARVSDTGGNGYLEHVSIGFAGDQAKIVFGAGGDGGAESGVFLVKQ